MGANVETTTGTHWRERYAHGAHALDTALAGLAEADLDRALAPGEWPIREIVNHLAEVEIRATFIITVALGNSGATWSFDWFPGTNKAWGAARGFDARPIAPSLATIRQVRAYVLTLLAALPDAGGRFVLLTGGEIDSEPLRMSVDQGIEWYSQHLDEHLTTIHAIRARHA